MTYGKKSLAESALFRWSVLIIISISMFSIYYYYDVFSAIKSTLQAETGLTNAQYGLMYGAYSFTNVFLLMTFFGGIIIDRWGVRKTGVLFSSFIVIGAAIIAYGGSSYLKPGAFGYAFSSSFLPQYSPNLKFLIFGRVVLGLGAETLAVLVQNKLIIKWFKKKELALAMAINVSFSRLGTAAVLIISPMLSVGLPKPSVNNAVFFALILVVIGFISILIYNIADKKYDKSIGYDIAKDGTEKFCFSDILNLLKNKSFILITLLCVIYYAIVFPFIGFAPDFLHSTYGLSIKESGKFSTILPYGTIIFSPIFGWCCDYKGRGATLMIIGTALVILVYIMFMFTVIPPYIPLFLLGISFSLIPAIMWPAVSKVIDEKLVGTAYGFMYTIQNFGMMVVPVIVGIILDMTNKKVAEGAPLNYQYTIYLFLVLGVLAFLLSILIKIDDKKSNRGLDLPNIQAA